MPPDAPGRSRRAAAGVGGLGPRGAALRLRMTYRMEFGVRDEWGREAPFGVSAPDRRQHVYVVGKSGTGKTTLLRNLILQDVRAGRGVGVIDPHGDLAEGLLDLIPKRRTEDVLYFDPADAERPVGLNPFARVPRERRHLAASGIVSALKGIWPDSWGPRLEYILFAAVSAVLDCEGQTLLGVQRMLSDEGYRRWVVRQVEDPMVRAFWESEFDRYDRRFLQEAVAPIQNKLGQILMSPRLRSVLAQPRGKLDARRVMDEGLIFIANLSKGRLGEGPSSLLGALLVSQFQLAAMSRADSPEERRRDFHLYVDEFQSFASDSFASLLSEARKYRLCLTISHQYAAQLRPGILDAVLGNVGSIVSFRVGHEDAEAMSRAFGGSFLPGRFVGLSNGEVCAKLTTSGVDAEPFAGRTLPPQGPRCGRGEKILRRSRERWAGRREEVEERVERWLRRAL